jgi:hypothetical protein
MTMFLKGIEIKRQNMIMAMAETNTARTKPGRDCVSDRNNN